MTPTIERKIVTRLSAPRPRRTPAGNLPAALVISLLLHLLIYAFLPRIQNAAAPFGFTSSRKADSVSVALREKKPEAGSRKPEAKSKMPVKAISKAAVAKPAPRPHPNALSRPRQIAAKTPIRKPIPAAKSVAGSVASSPNHPITQSPKPVLTPVASEAPRPPTPFYDVGIIAEPRLSNAPPAMPSPAPPTVSELPGQRPEGESRFAAIEPDEVQAAKTREMDTTSEDLRNAVTAATQRSLLTARGGVGADVRGGTTDAALIPGEAISHGLPFRPADAAGVAPALNAAPVCIAYLVDVSGSMADGGKMERVRQALSDALNELKPEDSFTIIAFSDKAESLTGVAPLPANDVNRRIGHETATKLQPLGATNLSAALELAFAVSGLTHIVVLSDGSPSEGITGRDELVTFFRARNASHARLIALSVSADGAAQGADILALLAKESGGSFGTVNVGARGIGTPPANR